MSDNIKIAALIILVLELVYLAASLETKRQEQEKNDIRKQDSLLIERAIIEFRKRDSLK